MEQLSSVEALAAVVEGGAFEENHYLEAKTSCDLGSKTAKVELARDMAQFAIDGGTLVIGVAEDKNARSFSLCPCPLGMGVVEQIEQIAQTRCQPPLPIQVRALADGDDPGQGFLVITVPPSTRAPHMVDGKYPARGEATRRYLTDTEVRLLVGKSEDAEAVVRAQLEEWVESDPYTSGEPRTAHMFGVAVPLSSRQDDPVSRDVALRIREEAKSHHLTELRSRFSSVDTRRGRGLSSNLETPGHARQRSDGWAYQTPGLRDLGSVGAPSAEERLAEWELSESGTIRMYDAGLSVHRDGPNGRIHAAWPDVAVDVAGVLVHSAVLWAKEHGYHGEWGLGLVATGMRGAQADPHNLSPGFPVVDWDRCDRVVLTSSHELAGDTGAVLDRLLRRVLNTFGDPDRITPHGQGW